MIWYSIFCIFSIFFSFVATKWTAKTYQLGLDQTLMWMFHIYIINTIITLLIILWASKGPMGLTVLPLLCVCAGMWIFFFFFFCFFALPFLELLLNVIAFASGLAADFNRCVFFFFQCARHSVLFRSSEVCLQVINALGFWPVLGKMRSFMTARP